MGATASVAEEKELFNKLKIILDEKKLCDDSDLRDEDTDEVGDDNYVEYDPTIANKQDSQYLKAQMAYSQWYFLLQLKKNVFFSTLLDFELVLEKAFSTGLTPLISDCSLDDKICTFYSYQTNAIILEVKILLMDSMRRTTLYCLDMLRKSLVNAMKYGKLLVIRLDTTAPDFLHKWNDGSQKINYDAEKIGYFPLETLLEGGKTLRTNELYAKLLFREEDMKPHRNVAFCRDEFRVCLVSRYSLQEINKYLFGLLPPGGDEHDKSEPKLPERRCFQLISVNYDDEEEEVANEIL